MTKKIPIRAQIEQTQIQSNAEKLQTRIIHMHFHEKENRKSECGGKAEKKQSKVIEEEEEEEKMR